ncbi:Hypothetical Protein FCC1311_017609 [Hondaea fermentalgiana]|uniref:Uncharacterized protein n=1 Tax=Hondaea fermentalgiana TaxID=2315210 RepID=A0A2R5G3F1_9STRA|nr:Hypothetical Protein FCC1311_017609 [Hondaea fermentalgiana]|eukprot:GBG25542.1 Hypothetical Protein FCC1311_017609 [Hondaea fermentalgiana]
MSDDGQHNFSHVKIWYTLRQDLEISFPRIGVSIEDLDAWNGTEAILTQAQDECIYFILAITFRFTPYRKVIYDSTNRHSGLLAWRAFTSKFSRYEVLEQRRLFREVVTLMMLTPSPTRAMKASIPWTTTVTLETFTVVLVTFIFGALSGGLLVLQLWSSASEPSDRFSSWLFAKSALPESLPLLHSLDVEQYDENDDHHPACEYDPHQGIHVVTACSKNHAKEILDMVDSLQRMWASRANPGSPRTDKLHLHIFVLKNDLPQTIIDTYLKAPCNMAVTVEKFDYAWLGFKDHEYSSAVNKRILGLTNSLWKPIVMRRVAKEIGPCQVMFWCDASVRFGKAFGPIRVWDDVARKNGLVLQFQLDAHNETLPKVTHPMTFKMLSQLTRGRVSSDIMDYRGIKSNSASFQIWYTGNSRVMDILEDLANCALVKECMAPEGASGFTGFGKCHQDFEGHCQIFKRTQNRVPHFCDASGREINLPNFALALDPPPVDQVAKTSVPTRG